MKKNKTLSRQAMKTKKEQAMSSPGEESTYARKKNFLKKNGGWGWQYSDKPWKKKR